MNMPRTNYHLREDNSVERMFWGKIPLERGTSFFYYHKGSDFRHILHQLKYGGRKDLGEIMGRFIRFGCAMYAAWQIVHRKSYNRESSLWLLFIVGPPSVILFLTINQRLIKQSRKILSTTEVDVRIIIIGQ